MRILFLLAAPALLAQTPPPPPPPNPGDVQAGSTLYATACAGCHGPTGEGGRGPNLADSRLVRRRTDAEIVRLIREGVPGSDMPAMGLSVDKAKLVTAFVRAMGTPAADVPAPGSAAAGRAVFEGKGGCGACHAIAGRGGALGPDLSNIGAVRTYKQLRESVLDPGARLADGFQGVDIVRRDGKRISGVLKNASNYSVQFAAKDGEIHLLDAGEVRELVYRKDSYMPAGFGERLSRREIDDLLAYLGSQTLRSER